MKKDKLTQTILVEGRYDKARLSGLLDAHIITTEGFGIFKDKEKLETLRRLAKKNGLVIVTDSDRAGFRIRSYVGGAIPPEYITHVYIPDVFGKERRKTEPGKEGKLGVEGISNELLRQAFVRAGLLAERVADGQPSVPQDKERCQPFTVGDMVHWGLSGGQNSFQKRRYLQKKLGLPERLSAKGLLEILNRLYTREQVEALLLEWENQ